jgi:tRNA(Ile)-lysidine synthetase-like protein
MTNILEYDWVPSQLILNKENIITNTLRDFIISKLDTTKNNIIILSLSGGVDSMVISYILKDLSIENLKCVMVHLNYNNRAESILEAEFIKKWCELIKLPLYYRNIDELKRDSSDREDYERITHKIRFDFYNEVFDEYPKYNHIGVILGHHKGDIQENIIFNFMKGRTLIDLTVMRESTIIDNITILRPLIIHPKSLIYELAKRAQIPYFKNSTPSWSNRGQTREKLLPLLQKIFGIGSLENVSKAGRESDELKDMVINKIINPYYNTIIRRENIFYFPLIKENFTFWKYVMMKFCSLNNLPNLTNKSLEQLYDRIINTKLGKIPLNKQIKGELKIENLLIYI